MATIRKRRDRGNRYQVLIRHRGFPTKSKLFVNLRDARQWAREQEALSDQRVLKFKPKINKLTAKVGNVIFLDTCKCYHYGSRPTKNSKPRCMLALHFVTSQSRELPLWGIKNISVLNNLNIKKFSKEYKNKVLNYFFRHYVANKKMKFYS